MFLPQSDILSTKLLNRVFDKTTATYKFYWLLGLLEYAAQGKRRISIKEMFVSIVANSWYPVAFFRLSFGKSEKLHTAILKLQSERQIPINISRKELFNKLNKLIEDKGIYNMLKFLQENVPYRFLMPWFKTTDNKKVVERALTWENGCLYRLIDEQENMQVEINECWMGYLQENYEILCSFAYWGLARFVQTRNPNVPNIPDKLIKTEERNSLAKQHAFWNTAINHGLEVKCLYTGKLLKISDYALDHFIPWSFVSHDLLWNLMPADSSINSSKSNHLPDLDCYLPHLAEMQQAALRINLKLNRQPKLLEDYLSLGHTPQEIADMDREHLLDCFTKTFVPMSQIAQNMGFEIWKYTRS